MTQFEIALERAKREAGRKDPQGRVGRFSSSF